MTSPDTKITIRNAQKAGISFILSLSPSLTGAAKLHWHKDETVHMTKPLD